jgi:hypothetical protein
MTTVTFTSRMGRWGILGSALPTAACRVLVCLEKRW